MYVLLYKQVIIHLHVWPLKMYNETTYPMARTFAIPAKKAKGFFLQKSIELLSYRHTFCWS